MGCALTTEQYIPVVENLIRLNPGVYTNYDNAARFILTASLTEEQKKLALHNMAHIYNGLSGLNQEKYKIGKGIDIINLGTDSLIDNTPEYISNAFKLFDLKRPRLQSFDGVSKSIEELGKQSLITIQDLTKTGGVLQLLKNYISTTKFETVEEKTDAINQIRGELKEVINDLSKVDE